MALVVLQPTPACSHPCGGDCCRRFVLSQDPQARADKVAEILAWQAAGGGPLHPWMDELLFVADMLVDTGVLSEEEVPRTVWTCRHLDTGTGRCTMYAQRPAVCREYPQHEPLRTCRSCGYHVPLIEAAP